MYALRDFKLKILNNKISYMLYIFIKIYPLRIQQSLNRAVLVKNAKIYKYLQIIKRKNTKT